MSDEFNPTLDAFDNGEGEDIVHPVTGYKDRPTEWFLQNILPDFLATKERLHLGESLLDIGCAYGYFTKQYAKHFKRVIGIDFSAKRIATAKECNGSPNITYLEYDILRRAILDVPSLVTLTAAISSAVFQHIDPKNRYLSFSNARSFLPNDAYLILYDEDFNKRPEVWAGFYSPLSAEWISENLSDIFTLQAQEYICMGVSGETIYRWELQAK